MAIGLIVMGTVVVLVSYVGLVIDREIRDSRGLRDDESFWLWGTYFPPRWFAVWVIVAGAIVVIVGIVWGCIAGFE